MDGEGNRNNELTDTTIDFLKFIFSIFIVGIHTEVFSEDNFASWFLLHWLFRIGVPFFFITSGYYLGKKLWSVSEGFINKIFKDYRRRLIPPLVYWGGVNLAISVLSLYLRGVNKHEIMIFGIKTIIFYPLGAMWFVWACIVASYFVQLFWKYKKLKLLGVLAIMGYAFALSANTYYYVFDNTVCANIINRYMSWCLSARNGVFVGTLFLFEGIMLASDKSKDLLINVKKWMFWLVFLLSEFVFVIEISFSYKKDVLDDSSLFLIFPILIPIIVILALKYKIAYPLPYSKLRKLSTSIYFSHRFILVFVSAFYPSGIITFILVVTISIGVGIAVQKLNKPFLNKIFL